MLNLPFRVAAKYALPGAACGRFHIFIFHRVLAQMDPLFPNSEPDIKRFDKIVRAISSVYNVLPLDEAVSRLHSDTLPARTACISFDDGYLDNYTNALPVLKKYKVPATVFIASHYMQGEIMWNDRIIEAVKQFDGKLALPSLGVNGYDCSLVENKRHILRVLVDKIKYLLPAERLDAVDEVEVLTKFKHKNRMMMCEDEVRELRKSGMLIGAHTQTHPILTSLDDVDSRREIENSKSDLEAVLGETVISFAYPNGRYGRDYNERHALMVKEAGFEFAVSTNSGVVKKTDPLYELPRFTPWDINISKFIARSIYVALGK